MSQLRIGQIGIGALGSRIATKLIWSGFPLHVYDTMDVSVRMFNAEYGGMMTGSPKMIAEVSDVVITVLPTEKEVQDVLYGWEGMTKGMKRGGIVLDMGTTDPVATVTFARELAARGIYLVDAPAIGSRYLAKEGKLKFVIGGEDEAVERCRPIFDALSEQALHVGPAGSGQAANALADYLRAAAILAATEALEVGRRFGLSPDAILDVGEAFGGIAASAKEVLRANVLTRQFETGIALGQVMKDINLARNLARATKVSTPLLSACAGAWAAAQDKIGSGADHSEMLRWLEQLLPPEPAKPNA
jgi:3-hydroxyisobutyrate dehydrogenase